MQKQNFTSLINNMLALVWKMHSKNHELYMQKFSHSQPTARGMHETNDNTTHKHCYVNKQC